MTQRTFDAFIDSQHSLDEGTKRGYKLVYRRFTELAQLPFEFCYLDHDVVHRVLAELDKRLEPSTWNLWLQRYQRLAKWLSDPDDEICPKVWHKIEFKKIDWEKKLAEKCFSEDEFYRLLDVVDHPRDKAFFAVGYEAGLRPGELLGMNIKNCKPASYGFQIFVSGKTGSRSVPIVLFAPLLRLWLNHHPLKHTGDSPLWVERKKGGGYEFGRVSYDSMNHYHFKRYCDRAKIYRWKTVKDKKTGQPKQINGVSLHYLRHSKVTLVAKNRKVHVGVKQANEMFGWKGNSPMFLRYSHIAGQDSENAFLAIAGVEEAKPVEKPSILLRKKCLNCGEQNSAEALYCFQCGMVMDAEQAKRIVADRQQNEELMRKFRELLDKK